MQRLITGLAALLPERYKRALSGSPGNPSSLGKIISSIFNLLQTKRFPILPCAGVLEGYSMKIDWQKHRSFLYGTWEPDVVNTISKVVSKGSVALDIGSHIGFYALLLAKLVSSNGRVFAFEPLKVNFIILEENINLNHCTWAQAINKAVMDISSKELRMLIPDDNPHMLTSSLHGSFEGSDFVDKGETVVVESISIDDFRAELRLPINFIKIDAEGAEALIIKGAAKTIEQDHPDMLVELHHLNASAQSHPVIDTLGKLGYKIEWVDNNHPTSHILAKWTLKSN